MLRNLVLALLLLNLGFCAWTQGQLDHFVGVQSRGDSEPLRLGQQLNPDRIKIVPPPSAAKTAALANGCLEIGPLQPGQLSAAQELLYSALAAERWIDVKTQTPAVWIVAMLPHRDASFQEKRLAQLQEKGIPFDVVTDLPKLGNALSLGQFNSRPDAEKALTVFAQRGLTKLQTAQFLPAMLTHTLRADRIEPALQEQLKKLQGNSALAGRGFKACELP
jgi:hypothetical protein